MDKEEAEELINFWSHLHLDLDPGISWRIIRYCKIGIFHSYHENCVIDVSLNKKLPVTCRTSDSYWIRLGRGLRFPSTLVVAADDVSITKYCHG